MTLSDFKYKAKGLFKLATLRLINAKHEFFEAVDLILTDMSEGNIEKANKRFYDSSKKVYAELLAAAQIAVVSLPMLCLQAAVEYGTELFNNGVDLVKSFFGFASEAVDEVIAAPVAVETNSATRAVTGFFNTCATFCSNLLNKFSEPDYEFIDSSVIEVEAPVPAEVAPETAVDNRLPKLMTKMFDALVKHALKAALENYGLDDELDVEPAPQNRPEVRI